MFCSKCGSQNEDLANFCKGCGGSIGVVANQGYTQNSHQGYNQNPYVNGYQAAYVQNQKKLHRPKDASLGVKLLWISFGVGILGALFSFSSLFSSDAYRFLNSSYSGYPSQTSYPYSAQQGLYFGVIITALFSLGISSFFIYMIGEGRNWARIISFICFIIGVIYWFFSLFQSQAVITNNPVSAIAALTQFGLQGVAYVLLFQRPVSNWFKMRY